MHSASSKSAFDYSEEFAHVLALIEDAQSIALSGHTSPDGDALGSVLGLGLAIQKRYPEKQVAFLLADDAPVPRIYRFLAGSDSLVPACRYTDTPDLFISVDCPVLDRLADAAGVAKRAHTSVCFDHHPARTEFADVVVRCVGAAAVAVLIGTFLAELQFDISPEIGTCLLCGIVTDTGRFQYQNANADAFYVASYLVGCGADPAQIALEVYQSQRLEYLRLESLVMGRIRTAAHGRVAYSYARAEDLENLGVTPDECDGLVDVVRAVMGVEVCLFLKDVPGEPLVRGNLRSKGALDVSDIAAQFGGGGHAAAAGFTYRGTVEDTLEAILPMLVALVGEDPTGVHASL